MAEAAEVGFIVFTCAPTCIVFVDEEVLREVPTCFICFIIQLTSYSAEDTRTREKEERNMLG